MTKVIKGEFEKLEFVNISDVLLTCNTSLEIFNEEFNRMSRMEDDLFTYEVEIAKATTIPCDLKKEYDSEQQMSHETDDDMEYDPSDVEFTEWAFKEFNYLLQIDPDDEMIDEDDESSNEGWKRWDNFDITNRDNEESENVMEHEEEERCKVFDDHERPICYIRRFEMIKYSIKDARRI
ncbi:hypothetical protein Tco_0639069 [Tanacetum coccineum]